MKNYIGGNWQEARKWIDQCFRLKPKDGPTQTLSNVMSESNYVAPSDWKGCRALTEK